MKVCPLSLNTDQYGGCIVNSSNEYFFTSLLQSDMVLKVQVCPGLKSLGKEGT